MAVAVNGVDFREPPSDSLAATLRQALWDNQVLCIRGQDIGPGSFLTAVSAFGEPLVRP